MPLPLILGTNAVTGGYEVANSLRFNSGSSDYLNRTPSSASNRDLWSISVWVKRSKLGIYSTIYGVYTDANNQENFGFLNNDKFQWQLYQSGGVVGQLTTNRLFRDVGSWYHILGVYDSANGTAGNRMRLYINGVEETSFATDTNPSSGQDSLWNNNTLHMIGGGGGASGGDFFDGYISELVAVDGTALSPTDVGEFDSDSPTIWKPIDVSGLTFGTNGFYLDSEDSSALGNDAAGSNNFTVNNLTAIDQSTDTCTNNFATMNPSNPIVHTFSEGNLRLTGTTTNWDSACSTIGASSGKWYFEMKFLALYGGLRRAAMGLVDARDQSLLMTNEYGYIVTGAVGDCVGYNGNGSSNNIKKNDNNVANGTQWSVNDIICMAADLDNGAVYFRVNDSAWLNSANPESGASKTGAVTITVGEDYVFGGTAYGNTTDWQFNYGAPSFSISSGNADANGHGNFEYAVPSGYFSLCTKNLAEHG